MEDDSAADNIYKEGRFSGRNDRPGGRDSESGRWNRRPRAAVPFPRNTPNEGIESSVVGRRMTQRIARSPRCARSLPRATDCKASSLRNTERIRPSLKVPRVSQSAAHHPFDAQLTGRRLGFAPRIRGSTSRLVSRLDFAPRIRGSFLGSISRLDFAPRIRGSFRGSIPRRPPPPPFPNLALAETSLVSFRCSGRRQFQREGAGRGVGAASIGTSCESTKASTPVSSFACAAPQLAGPERHAQGTRPSETKRTALQNALKGV